jgi:hypothetical protein
MMTWYINGDRIVSTHTKLEEMLIATIVGQKFRGIAHFVVNNDTAGGIRIAHSPPDLCTKIRNPYEFFVHPMNRLSDPPPGFIARDIGGLTHYFRIDPEMCPECKKEAKKEGPLKKEVLPKVKENKNLHSGHVSHSQLAKMQRESKRRALVKTPPTEEKKKKKKESKEEEKTDTDESGDEPSEYASDDDEEKEDEEWIPTGMGRELQLDEMGDPYYTDEHGDEIPGHPSSSSNAGRSSVSTKLVLCSACRKYSPPHHTDHEKEIDMRVMGFHYPTAPCGYNITAC